MELLRGRGVTVLFLRAVSPRVGPELDFAESALEVVAENVLLLRQVVDEGVLQRMLCILKMRDARYDPSIRQYTLDARGFHVHKLTESPSDVLQRMARLLNVRRELSTEGDAE
jgi:circadian clock protein KaiC